VTVIAKKSGIEEPLLHMDNCKVHGSAKIMKRVEEFQVTRLHHPPYSLNVSVFSAGPRM
jgi:hypothetical protein